MALHALCRPPTNVKLVGVLKSSGRIARRGAGEHPGLAFIAEDPADDSACIVYVVDCVCRGDKTCPRARALAWAADNYDSTTIELLPAF